MASVAECIEKLAVAGEIPRAVANEALEMFKRSQAKYSAQMGPASADAAAALETAKNIAARSKDKLIANAAAVKTWRTVETRLADDPRGVNAAAAGMLTKDTRIGDNKLKPLMREQPEHPIFREGSIDENGKAAARSLYSMVAPEMEKLRPGFFADPQVLRSVKNFVYERFGVNTGDTVANVFSGAFQKMADYAVDRARLAGKIFDAREDWRVPQPWTSRRVANTTPDEFVKDFRDAMDTGGLKLWDKDTNAYATADRYDYVLRRAYNDIKAEGGSTAPFSKEMRTFEFQQGKAGADQYLRLQGKYGVGNEIMQMIDGHIEHMGRTIGLHEMFGPNPDATFAAIMRKVREGPGSTLPRGTRIADSERTLRLTYDVVSGKGHPVANDFYARLGSGARNLIGAASLRNLPITIIPSDTVMTFLATHHLGTSFTDVMSHTFDGKMTRQVAQHLQISSHSYMDYIADRFRRYEDEINVSGLARKVPRAVVNATGAQLWTQNGRQGFPVSQIHVLTEMRNTPFDKLNPKVREQWLMPYGITAEDWDKIRAAPLYDPGNGAKYFDVNHVETPIRDRLMRSVHEQSSYAFHQPDARTEAIAKGGVSRGSLPGEGFLMVTQYKQFALERLTTHLMRVLLDGPMENRVARGAAFLALSAAAGAVSLQAAAVLRGEDPMSMHTVKFWEEALAKGGAGGVYGDLLAQALRGGRSGTDIVSSLAGPVPGLIGDIANITTAPARMLTEEPNKQTKPNTAFSAAKRWTPNTWFTKLAVDRLIWEKLQVALDPNYRQSFRRSEQRLHKEGRDFWWDRGASAPSRAPDLGTAIRRH